jgi:hypothetical protein
VARSINRQQLVTNFTRAIELPPNQKPRFSGSRLPAGAAANADTSASRLPKKDVGILITGCEDHQTSMDAYSKERRQMHGALTNAFVKTVAKNPKTTYRQLLTEVRAALYQDRYEQNPRLACFPPHADRFFLDSFEE